MLFTALFFFPQSPRWLASKDRFEECLAELARLHGHGDPDAPLVQAEYAEIQEAMQASRDMGAVQWSELVQRDNIQRILAGIFIHIWTQLSGNNAILFYVSYVFQMSGLTGNISLIAAGVQYAVQVVCTLPAIIYIDRLGRRPALMIGSALMAIFLYSTAATMATNGHYVPGGLNGTKAVSWVINSDAHNAQRAVIACTYLLVAAVRRPIMWSFSKYSTRGSHNFFSSTPAHGTPLAGPTHRKSSHSDFEARPLPWPHLRTGSLHSRTVSTMVVNKTGT